MTLSFRLKTIIGVALIEGSLLLFLVWSSIDYLQHSNEDELRTRAQTTAELLANLSRDPILSLDLALLESFARQALNSQDAVYVRIMDTDRTLIQVGNNSALSKSFKADNELANVNDGVFDVASNLEHSGIRYGRVELGLSIDRATSLFQTAIRHLSIIAAVEMLLVALFSYVLGSYLTRGLSFLRDASIAIADGAVGHQVVLTGNDELTQTGEAFNIMSKRMGEAQTNMAANIRRSELLTKRLSEQEMRLSTILNTVLDGFVVFDSHDQIHDINAVGTRLFGYNLAELKGGNMKLLIPSLRTQKHHTSQQNIEVSGLHKNGQPFPIKLTVSEMELSGKQMFIGLVHDLSEQRKMEYEARRNAIMKSALVSANLDALITIDVDENIVEFNRVAEHMFGYQREQVIGTSMPKLIIPPESKDCHKIGMENFLSSGMHSILGQRIETEAMRSNGELFPVEMAVQLIEVDGERMFTAFIRDIGDRREAETALKAAKREAESASEAKSRFLAHMSHEIRSPLNAVLGSVELLLDDELKGEQRLYAKTAQTSARALLSLINDVLDFSKIEARQMQLDQAPFSLNKLFDDVADVVGFQARDKNIQTVIIKNPGTSEQYIGDTVRIRQILLNLVDNAIKFTSSGAVVLSVTQHPDDVNQLRFVVEDSGIGIAQEAHKTLFDEFQQVDNSDATQHGGSGLGLSISHGLCEAMQGTMSIESALGLGSRFTLDLPLKRIDGDVLEVRDDSTANLDGIIVGLHPLIRSSINRYANSSAMKKLDFASSSAEALNQMPHHNSFLLATGNLDSEELMTLASKAQEHQIKHKILLAPVSDRKLDLLIKTSVYDFVLSVPLTLHRLQQTISDSSYSPGGRKIHKPAGQESETRSTGHILLAEDSSANRIVASGILQRAGFTLDTADDGQQVIEALKTTHYDLILMDIRMPVMDGIEATHRIRKLESDQNTDSSIPIIAMTANTSEVDQQRCFKAGMDDFVPKPIDRKQLLNVLARFIRPTAPNQSSSSTATTTTVTEESDTLPLLDEKIIEQLVNDTSPDALPKMLHLFIEEIVTRSSRIQDDAHMQAWETMENEAHTLKSCAGTFGARQLQAVASSVELACREKELHCLELETTKLANIMNRTLSAFHDKYPFLVLSNGRSVKSKSE